MGIHHQKQGFVDAGKDSPLKLTLKHVIIDQALLLFTANPKSTSTFIRDPQGVFNQNELEKLSQGRLEGSEYGSGGQHFRYDTNDDEIFADGPEVFDDSEWGYRVTQAIAAGQNDAVESSPPKVSVEQIKGKTGAGWRITISKPYQFYLDQGEKAGEKAAAELAKKKIFPHPERGTGRSDEGAYQKIRQRWARKG
jgi:hypothetical protein